MKMAKPNEGMPPFGAKAGNYGDNKLLIVKTTFYQLTTRENIVKCSGSYKDQGMKTHASCCLVITL